MDRVICFCSSSQKIKSKVAWEGRRRLSLIFLPPRSGSFFLFRSGSLFLSLGISLSFPLGGFKDFASKDSRLCFFVFHLASPSSSERHSRIWFPSLIMKSSYQKQWQSPLIFGSRFIQTYFLQSLLHTVACVTSLWVLRGQIKSDRLGPIALDRLTGGAELLHIEHNYKDGYAQSNFTKAIWDSFYKGRLKVFIDFSPANLTEPLFLSGPNDLITYCKLMDFVHCIEDKLQQNSLNTNFANGSGTQRSFSSGFNNATHSPLQTSKPLFLSGPNDLITYCKLTDFVHCVEDKLQQNSLNTNFANDSGTQRSFSSGFNNATHSPLQTSILVMDIIDDTDILISQTCMVTLDSKCEVASVMELVFLPYHSREPDSLNFSHPIMSSNFDGGVLVDKMACIEFEPRLLDIIVSLAVITRPFTPFYIDPRVLGFASSHLSGVKEPEPPFEDKHLRANAKIGCTDLVLEIFNIFFSAVWDDHHDSLINAMNSIMIKILNESEEAFRLLLELAIKPCFGHVSPKLGHQLVISSCFGQKLGQLLNVLTINLQSSHPKSINESVAAYLYSFQMGHIGCLPLLSHAGRRSLVNWAISMVPVLQPTLHFKWGQVFKWGHAINFSN
ncbi:hypothetical protein VNO77_19286 [Canavalia gladiata]|uniref:Uncharacterized protein n=1 Tax=Canavalia gladiata TaxID=3824 RepID=A0AAN9LR96_CANGL